MANLAYWSGLTPILEGIRDWQYGRYIRMVSYHDTPPQEQPHLESHFRFFRDRYHPATWQDVAALCQGGSWDHAKPGIVFSFDDGAMSNYTTAAPLLREYGFHGIFLIPTDWTNSPDDEQAAYALAHGISPGSCIASPRRAMSWDELRELAMQGHIIASHTRSHRRFSASDTRDTIEYEVDGSRALLEAQLGQPPEVFSWVGGEASVYQPAVHQAVLDAGYAYTLTTIAGPLRTGMHPHKIGRTALGSGSSLTLVRLMLLSPYDRKYNNKGRIVYSQAQIR